MWSVCLNPLEWNWQLWWIIHREKGRERKTERVYSYFRDDCARQVYFFHSTLKKVPRRFWIIIRHISRLPIFCCCLSLFSPFFFVDKYLWLDNYSRWHTDDFSTKTCGTNNMAPFDTVSPQSMAENNTHTLHAHREFKTRIEHTVVIFFF